MAGISTGGSGARGHSGMSVGWAACGEHLGAGQEPYSAGAPGLWGWKER